MFGRERKEERDRRGEERKERGDSREGGDISKKVSKGGQRKQTMRGDLQRSSLFNSMRGVVEAGAGGRGRRDEVVISEVDCKGFEMK